jgi:hypothetical protein
MADLGNEDRVRRLPSKKRDGAIDRTPSRMPHCATEPATLTDGEVDADALAAVIPD